MTNPLPKWIQNRYAVLWAKFRDKPFTHEQAVKTLNDKEGVVSVFMSDLKRAGWLEVILSKEDTRIRLYKLKEPNQAIKEMIR
jgi:type I restriction enzyme M protein